MSTRLDCGCPEQWPDWQGDVDLGGMLVHAQPVPMLLHMPIALEAALLKQMQDLARLELHERWPGFVLVRSAAFRGEALALLQEEHSPARRTRRLPRPFWLRVTLHEGDVGSLKPTIGAMQRTLIEEGKMPKELYLAYLTCPRCAAQRGGFKVMVLRRWQQSPRLMRRRRA